MQFILKDNFIYIVGNTGLANNKVEGELVTKYCDQPNPTKYSYSINGGAYSTVINERITINFKELKEKYVKLRIKGVSASGVATYDSDKIPFTNAIVFGLSIEDAYPEVIKTLFTRLNRVDDNMLKFVDALEEIKNEGNLF